MFFLARQVSKVRSFLEGFRRAEVRRLSRETTNLLLDKFVREGIEGLDLMLAGMTRSDDDTNDEAGELNDSLLEYLNSAIRQQEKKVEQIVKSSEKITEFERIVAEAPPDHLEHLWKVGSEDGKRVETFDPNDPISIKALREEYERTANEARAKIALPKSAAERLLMLLKLLRERIKIEAAFPQDEKSRNLRVLAYCMQLETDDLRKELLKKELGSSLDVSTLLSPFFFNKERTTTGCFVYCTAAPFFKNLRLPYLKKFSSLLFPAAFRFFLGACFQRHRVRPQYLPPAVPIQTGILGRCIVETCLGDCRGNKARTVQKVDRSDALDIIKRY